MQGVRVDKVQGFRALEVITQDAEQSDAELEPQLQLKTLKPQNPETLNPKP